MKSLIIKIWNIFSSLALYIVALSYTRLFRINNSKIWLISERGNDARDNGWHFYNYLKNKHPEITAKYIITNDSQDLAKVAPEDRVKYRSFKHYILFLSAGKLISTHIMGYSPEFSLFWRLDKIGLVKLRGKRIFLQHGITQNYIEFMSSKVSKLDLFISGAKPEYDYILKTYGYGDETVKYTGFARFDKLQKKESNQILIMPTWRKWLKYCDNFSRTEYYKKWNSILNNKELLNYLEENNKKVIFYPHYEMQKYLNSFKVNSPNVVIADIKEYDVQQLLIESELLITDYSSVHFDFAYMDKPVVYYQFDRGDFYKKHYTKGYYDYEENGFGPVCLKRDEVLAVIKEGTAFRKYANRAKVFFPKRDCCNCDRIYCAIKELDCE